MRYCQYTEPGQFEVYISPFLKENEQGENSPYIKEDPTEDYTMTSFFLDDILLPSGIDLSADADVRKIMFCEMYAQDYFPGQPHRFHEKELINKLKQRGITSDCLYTKAETRKIKREAKEERWKGAKEARQGATSHR